MFYREAGKSRRPESDQLEIMEEDTLYFTHVEIFSYHFTACYQQSMMKYSIRKLRTLKKYIQPCCRRPDHRREILFNFSRFDLKFIRVLNKSQKRLNN